ncbi:NAD(P)-binding protein, partial [Meira miltonrushii]
WNDQLAIVTGASGGLGASIAKKLIARGCGGVICVDIKNNEWLQKGEGNNYPRAKSIRCDISRPEEITQLANTIKEQFSDRKVSILISNAGIMHGAPLLDLPEGQFEKTINVNFTSSYYLLRAFLPDMISAGRGHIVATSSVMAYLGVSRLSDYVASKHALTGLMESLRYELDKIYRKPNIRTSIVVLGQMTTPLFSKYKMSSIGGFLMPLQDPDSVAEDIVDNIHLNKSSYIYRPYLARLATIVQAMPQWIRDLAQKISGADEAFQN